MAPVPFVGTDKYFTVNNMASASRTTSYPIYHGLNYHILLLPLSHKKPGMAEFITTNFLVKTV